jgi:hypothetical protein
MTMLSFVIRFLACFVGGFLSVVRLFVAWLVAGCCSWSLIRRLVCSRLLLWVIRLSLGLLLVVAIGRAINEVLAACNNREAAMSIRLRVDLRMIVGPPSLQNRRSVCLQLQKCSFTLDIWSKF